jgi:hypothetical protein
MVITAVVSMAAVVTMAAVATMAAADSLGARRRQAILLGTVFSVT